VAPGRPAPPPSSFRHYGVRRAPTRSALRVRATALNGSKSAFDIGSVVSLPAWRGSCHPPSSRDSLAAHACAQVLADFVLLHDPVIRLLCVPDRVSRFAEQFVEPDDLVSAFPDFELTILRVSDRYAAVGDAGRGSSAIGSAGTRRGAEVDGCAIAAQLRLVGR
jgi:hypothetical protein